MFEIYEETLDLFDRPITMRVARPGMGWLDVPRRPRLMAGLGYADGLRAADVAKKHSSSARCFRTMVVKVEEIYGKLERTVVKRYENGKLSKTKLIQEERVLGN